MRSRTRTKSSPRPGRSRLQHHRRILELQAIEEYLEFCFAGESPPRVSELARRLGMSRRELAETFRAATASSTSFYLKERQVGAAKLLLALTDLPIDRVGYAIGFGTRRTFFREFRQRTGMSPDAYRQAAHIVSRPRRRD